MPNLDYSVPKAASSQAKQKVERAVESVAGLTLAGEDTPLAKDVAVRVDAEGPLAKGEGTLRIGVLFNGSVRQWRPRNYAQHVYQAMEDVGIPAPEGDPKVGVQIRPEQDEVVIENTLPA